MCNSVVDTDVFFLLNPAITVAWNLIDLQSRVYFNTVSPEDHSVLFSMHFLNRGVSNIRPGAQNWPTKDFGICEKGHTFWTFN